MEFVVMAAEVTITFRIYRKNLVLNCVKMPFGHSNEI